MGTLEGWGAEGSSSSTEKTLSVGADFAAGSYGSREAIILRPHVPAPYRPPLC